MNISDRLSSIFSRRPKVTIMLMLPESIINQGYKHITMTTDNLEFFGCHGIIRNNYIFKGDVKVEA